MSMRSIKLEIEGFQDRKKNEWERTEYQSWLTGYYTLRGTSMLFSKKNKYPENPLSVKEVVVEDMELTDEEKDEWAMKWLDRLERMSKPAKKID